MFVQTVLVLCFKLCLKFRRRAVCSMPVKMRQFSPNALCLERENQESNRKIQFILEDDC